MGANDKLADLQVQHALHLLRYGNGVNRDIQKLLAGLERDVTALLAQRIATIEERGHDLGPTVTKRLNQTLDEIRAINGSVYGKVEAELTDQLEKLAKTEIKYGADALKKSTGIKTSAAVASPERLRAIVTERPIQGKLLSSFVKGAEAGTLDRVEGVIRSGMATGQTVDQMVRSIRGTKAANYADGLMATSRRSVEAIVRTSVTHVANQAQMESFKRNSNIIRGWQFVATLDSRTTLICAAHDSEIYPLGEGPMPPLHPNCRSTITAVTKSFDEMGLDRKDYTADQRASLDGQITNPGNFEKWLKGKDEAFQNGLLGKTRADLWRDGKFSLSDFVKDRNTVISLDELTAKNTTLTAVADEPALKAFNPVNPRITDDTVEVIPRLKAQKKLDTMLGSGAQDARYEEAGEFKGTKGKGWGKSSFPATMTDEAASMIVAIHPELDAMADRFGIPRLRAYRAISGSGTIGNMGDGSMGVNPTYFNAFASKVGGKSSGDLLASIAAKRDAVQAELEEMRAKIDGLRDKLKAMKTSDEGWADIYDEYTASAKTYNARVKTFNELAKRARVTLGKGGDAVNEWKPGDDVAKRPFNATDFFSGIDRARNVLYHEFAHHLHQTYKKVQRRTRGYKPPLEGELATMWRNKFYGVTPAHRAARDRQPSKYATTNEHEWFAENFAVYMMGRSDLADPDAIALIERLLNETD